MNNPRVTHILDKFNILDTYENFDIDNIFLEFNKGDLQASCTLHMLYYDNDIEPMDTPFTELVSLDTLCDILTRVSGEKITVGKDRCSLYTSHREIIDLRLIIPRGLLYITYKDESISKDVGDSFAEYLRSNFKEEIWGE